MKCIGEECVPLSFFFVIFGMFRFSFSFRFSCCCCCCCCWVVLRPTAYSDKKQHTSESEDEKTTTRLPHLHRNVVVSFIQEVVGFLASFSTFLSGLLRKMVAGFSFEI